MEFVQIDSFWTEDSLSYYYAWIVNLLFYYGSDTSQILIDTLVDYTVPFKELHIFDYHIGSHDIHCGDLNEDGKADIAIRYNTYIDPNKGYDETQVFIYMGSEIPPDTPSYHLGSKLHIPGMQYYDGFGSYFEVDNINGDEFDDLLIRERQSTNTIPYKDSLEILHIFYGKTDFTFFSDSQSVKYKSTSGNGWFNGPFSVTDINNDNKGDLIVGG